jgi:hypothetical protein
MDKIWLNSQMNITDSPPLIVQRANMSTLDWVRSLDTVDNVRVWYNNKAWASLPAYTNAYYNAFLRAGLVNDTQREHAGVMLINHPMGYTDKERKQSREVCVRRVSHVCVCAANGYNDITVHRRPAHTCV